MLTKACRVWDVTLGFSFSLSDFSEQFTVWPWAELAGMFTPGKISSFFKHVSFLLGIVLTHTWIIQTSKQKQNFSFNGGAHIWGLNLCPDDESVGRSCDCHLLPECWAVCKGTWSWPRGGLHSWTCWRTTQQAGEVRRSHTQAKTSLLLR